MRYLPGRSGLLILALALAAPAATAEPAGGGVVPAQAESDLVADPDLVAEGARLFRQRCASCHGPTATRGASGDIRGLSLSIIEGAIRGYDQMPRVRVGPDDAAAIAAWLSVALD